MENVLVEFNKDFSLMDVHANFSLSNLTGAVEQLPGVVLVSQPSIYELEVYLDRAFFENTLQRQTLKVKLRRLFNEFGITYTQN